MWRCSVNRMTGDDGARADMADEADWTAIPDDDEVWAAPAQLPPPLADPPPPWLNTNEMGWEPFERLVLHMARTLDGAHGARRYGRPGQGHHGLDVVGFFADRAPTVYQVKDTQQFRATDLEKAVELYAGGRRPFDADRMVVAVATEARDTRTVEKLPNLIQKHQDLHIELWDRQTPGAKYTHRDGKCSFEVLVEEFHLSDDAVLVRLAEIVHAADVSEDIDSSPEGRGLSAIAHGFALVHGTQDHKKIELESPVNDALYAWCQQQTA